MNTNSPEPTPNPLPSGEGARALSETCPHPSPLGRGRHSYAGQRFLLCAALAVLLTLWAVAHAPFVHAQSAPAAVAGPLADVLTGKSFPASLKSEQFDATFHLVDLVDLQGKSGTYATRGATVTVGSDTYLAAYPVLFAPGSRSRALMPGVSGDLALINLHSVQAMLNIRDVPPLASAAPVTTATP